MTLYLGGRNGKKGHGLQRLSSWGTTESRGESASFITRRGRVVSARSSLSAGIDFKSVPPPITSASFHILYNSLFTGPLKHSVYYMWHVL
jgi:hypothetical protein